MVVTANTMRVFRGQLFFLSETQYNVALSEDEFQELMDYVPPSTHMYPPLRPISKERIVQARKRKSRRQIKVCDAKRSRAEQRARKLSQQQADELRKKEVSKVRRAKCFCGFLWWCFRHPKNNFPQRYWKLATLNTSSIITDMIFKLYRVVPWVQHGIRHFQAARRLLALPSDAEEDEDPGVQDDEFSLSQEMSSSGTEGGSDADEETEDAEGGEDADEDPEDAEGGEDADEDPEDAEDGEDPEVQHEKFSKNAEASRRNLYQMLIMENVTSELKLAREAVAKWSPLAKTSPTDWNVHMLQQSRRTLFIQNMYHEDRAKGFHCFLVWCLHHSDQAKCFTPFVKRKYVSALIRRVAAPIVDYVFDLYRTVPWCLDLDAKKQVT